jgi:hypothetical protein
MMRQRLAEAFAREDAGAPTSVSPESSSSASSSRAPALSSSARSSVNTVTSSGRARLPRVKNEVGLTGRSSVTVSTGTSPRYSMRRATSAAVGAAIDPVTISPAWVNAL